MIGRGIGCGLSHGSDVLVPALEDVGVLSCGCLRGYLASVSRCRSVGYLASLEYSSVIINELDRILVDRAVKLRGVGRGSGYGGDLGIPAGEGVRRLPRRDL